ncbi:ABC-2 type transport system ATP-binding protein [Anaerosporobacter mobilis DSM 15930]|uniref:ABC-2 type transport system ATP-binding protein n=1 Tax=Anaerosporobacter mobilis DSM 15930 TaxID=1120996 RepID=A0A1M7JYB4_9FIRM|nr:ABC transporter ATP-binding protein [Anaerosporobacter mobilis]SHM58050.1 ABC-2 type transport system ATP-binding protein [Anaerosporobacter mobilis DSM 15930]
METEILLNQVNKFYGNKQALCDVNLHIEQGMFGLLGRNGAGKTTLMKVITTLLPASSGDIHVCGIPVKEERSVRSIIGYLPQDFSMYGNMTVYEAMDYLGVLSGLDKKTRKERIPELLRRVNLQNNKRTKVKAMSGGMKRRLGIAQAILHDPKVLIVDEPTAGLDPEERVRFRNLLSEIADDRIVILSTHIVGDIEATCEKIAIMDAGNIIFNGTVAELLEHADGKIYTATVSKIEIEDIKKRYLVTNMLRMPTEVTVRFVAGLEEEVFEGATSCTPNVEDAYMYLMHEKRGDR